MLLIAKSALMKMKMAWQKILVLTFFMFAFLLYSSNLCDKDAFFLLHPAADIDTAPAPGRPETHNMKILIGILTMASKFERRNLVRMAYRVQSTPGTQVTIKFILGRLKNEEERILIGIEMLHFQDIIILDCEENLNSGKTYHFFSKLAEMELQHDYVMKVDDDSYVRLPNLAKSLQELPRNDLYYGYILPCENTDPYKEYMAGMGYLISWDLVEYIGGSSFAKNYSVGTEDMLVGRWLDEGGRAKNRVNKKPLFYDHPEFGGQCAHDFVPDTILIHQLKSAQRWTQVLGYFEKENIFAHGPVTI